MPEPAMPGPALPALPPTGRHCTPAPPSLHAPAWRVVIEERARHRSRQRTGSDAFWRLYWGDIVGGAAVPDRVPPTN